jgi:hypothetical protein
MHTTLRRLLRPALLAAALGITLPATAADVDHFFAGDAGVAVDPVEAQGVDLVERFELGFGVPPAVGEVTEFLQFGGIGVHETASGK